MWFLITVPNPISIEILLRSERITFETVRPPPQINNKHHRFTFHQMMSASKVAKKIVESFRRRHEHWVACTVCGELVRDRDLDIHTNDCVLNLNASIEEGQDSVTEGREGGIWNGDGSNVVDVNKDDVKTVESEGKGPTSPLDRGKGDDNCDPQSFLSNTDGGFGAKNEVGSGSKRLK